MLKWKYYKKTMNHTEGVFLKCHKARVGSFGVAYMVKLPKCPWKDSPHYWQIKFFPNYKYQPYFSTRWLYVGNIDLRRAKKEAEKKIRKVLKEYLTGLSAKEKVLGKMNKSIEKVLCQDL